MAVRSLHWSSNAFAVSLPLIALGLIIPLSGARAVESDTTPGSDAKTSGYHATESLDACMRKWDPGTHMSREAWRASCMRIKNERQPHMKNQ